MGLGPVEWSEQLEAIEQQGSGLVRSTAMRDQNDPSTIRVLVIFESEEGARERENDGAAPGRVGGSEVNNDRDP